MNLQEKAAHIATKMDAKWGVAYTAEWNGRLRGGNIMTREQETINSVGQVSTERTLGINSMQNAIEGGSNSLSGTIARTKAAENYATTRGRTISKSATDSPYDYEPMPSGGHTINYSAGINKELLPDGRTMVTEYRSANMMYRNTKIMGSQGAGEEGSQEVEMDVPDLMFQAEQAAANASNQM